MQSGAQVAYETANGILQRIDALAAKLGTTAAQLWQVYLAQATVEALRDAALAVLLLSISTILGFKIIPFFWNKLSAAEKLRHDGDGWGAAAIITAIVCIGLTTAAVCFLYASVGEFANPAYWAFQHLTADLRNFM